MFSRFDYNKFEKLILYHNSTYAKNQLLKNHSQQLKSAIEEVFGEDTPFEILDKAEKEEFLKKNKPEANQAVAERDSEENKNAFNPKYTFDNFVVGKSNQFVYAAAHAVAENPGKKYNPLFIYGGVGLGKTHLLHAIGNYIKKNNKNVKILYVTSEQFTNDYIQALKADRKENANKAFRDKYREVDVLMIDDIQFIANKTSTQEEFFHTFNDLYQLDKQIVISSDKHPRNMETLEERLKSRFTGGLIQDIQPPDYETRLAILKKRREKERYMIDDSVLVKIATQVTSNIRELEGVFNKLKAYTSFTNNELTDEIIDSTIESVLVKGSKVITSKLIMQVVSKFFNIKVVDLLSSNRSKNVAYPRQIAMYLCRTVINMTFPQIGQDFGGKDHTTVIHACDKITKEYMSDPSTKDLIDDIKKSLSTNA